jgi:hypothetical protein
MSTAAPDHQALRAKRLASSARKRAPRGPAKPPAVQPCDVLQVLACLAVSPTAEDVSRVMQLPADVLGPLLRHLERKGLVESWTDETNCRQRLMLSARALSRLSLELSPDGTRWRSTASPPEPAADRWLSPPAPSRPRP